jgi:hypothetical protein
MNIYLYICIRIHMYMYNLIYIYIHIHIYVHVYVNIYILLSSLLTLQLVMYFMAVAALFDKAQQVFKHFRFRRNQDNTYYIIYNKN